MPELNATDIVLLVSSNGIVSGDLNETQPDQGKVSGETEPEKKTNESDM